MSIRVQVGKKRGKENEKKNEDQEEVTSPLKKSKSSPVKNGKTTKWIEFFWLKMVQSQSGFENILWKFKKIKDVSNVE